MNDCLDLGTRVWHDLAGYLQDLWKSLVTAFVAARQHPKFLADLGLGQFLPIREPIAALLWVPLRLQEQMSSPAAIRCDVRPEKKIALMCSVPARSVLFQAQPTFR